MQKSKQDEGGDRMINKIKNINILFFFKTGVGSAIAILLANRLGLMYSASAGIITLLTIQNTKKETVFIALRRIFAFIIAVIIAYMIFTNIGYTSVAFGVFVFIFVAACNILGLQDGISMNAVLTTHFLIEQRMDIGFLFNEIAILLIGMSIGIVINLVMPRNTSQILEKQKELEGQIKNTLRAMGKILKGEESLLKGEAMSFYFQGLDQHLESLLKRAYEDADNRFLSDTKYLISYLEMRKLQIAVLKDIMKNMGQIHEILPQAQVISKYMTKVADEFHEQNDVLELLSELEELNQFFKKERLPTSREEFENRAILFRILKDLQYFLELKRNFYLNDSINNSIKNV